MVFEAKCILGLHVAVNEAKVSCDSKRVFSWSLQMSLDYTTQCVHPRSCCDRDWLYVCLSMSWLAEFSLSNLISINLRSRLITFTVTESVVLLSELLQNVIGNVIVCNKRRCGYVACNNMDDLVSSPLWVRRCEAKWANSWLCSLYSKYGEIHHDDLTSWS